MPYSGCIETIELLNTVFAEPFVVRDGDKIRSQLLAGNDLRNVVTADYAERFGKDKTTVSTVLDHWDDTQFAAINQMVKWALDSRQRLNIRWKGDTESPELFTRFELRGDELMIEFAHPASWTKDVIRDIVHQRREARALQYAS